MMANVLIAVCHHRTSSIPAFLAHNMNFFRKKCIRSSYYRPDIEIMLKIFDGDMEAMTALIELFHDGFEPPITKFIDHIAPVALLQEFQIKPSILGPRQRMWANSY